MENLKSTSRLPAQNNHDIGECGGLCLLVATRVVQDPHLKALVEAFMADSGNCRSVPQCAGGQTFASRLD